MISKLLESEGFKYIAAYTNESKHRQLIQVRHTADIDDYLVVTRFTRRGNAFPQKWNTDITNSIVKEIRHKIVLVGNENNTCRCYERHLLLKTVFSPQRIPSRFTLHRDGFISFKYFSVNSVFSVVNTYLGLTLTRYKIAATKDTYC